MFELPLASEDLEVFNSQFLIGDLTDLYGAFHDLKTSKEGGIIAFNLQDLDASYSPIEIKNFPSEVRM